MTKDPEIMAQAPGMMLNVCGALTGTKPPKVPVLEFCIERYAFFLL